MGNKSLAYGEITYKTFQKVILWIEKTNSVTLSGKFIDLGHGAGKCIVAAALSGKFSSIKGIELLDGLYYESLR